MIISNSSPLIHLARVGKIDPLLRFHDKIIIPRAVFKEVIEDGIKAGYSDAIYLNNLISQGKIEVRDIQQQDPELQEYLHPGEYESILLAQELELPLVLDDRKARIVSSNRNLKCSTSLLAMLELFDNQIIDYDHFQKNVKEYGSFGWISPDVIELYLREAELKTKRIENEGDE